MPCPRKALHLGSTQPIGFVPLSLGTELYFGCVRFSSGPVLKEARQTRQVGMKPQALKRHIERLLVSGS